MGESDPVERAADGEDVYEVTDWEPRSHLDRIAVQAYVGAVAGSKWLVVATAVAITVAIVGVSGLDLVLEPVVGWLVVMSVLPALAIFAYVRYVDVTSGEPLGLLVITFLLATVVAGFAAVANTVALGWLGGVASALGEPVALAIFFYLVVGPVEESVKLLAVRLYAYPDERFDAVIDGAVYGAVAGLGFATIENAIYITDVIQAEGGLAASTSSELGGITASRAIAGPGHVLYSGIAGYYLGLAKFNPEDAGPLVAKGLIVAALFHGTYNFTIGPASGLLAELFPLAEFTAVVVYVVAFQSVVGYYLYRKIDRYRRAYDDFGAGNVETEHVPERTEFDP
jgi:RsiW-degrading membrane proteinase PrsW (M82 family)